VRDSKADEDILVAPISQPQAHVTRGYSPIAPTKPRFGDLIDPSIGKPAAPDVVAQASSSRPVLSPYINHSAAAGAARSPVPANSGVRSAGKRRSIVRRFATFVIFLGLFTGILYGTASYMRGKGVLPTIRNPFRTQTATANTDIYLRPSPSTDNDPVGLVTKNSKVRIVNSQNNWYQVDVMEQGRARPGSPNATRGWLNGKYLDIDDN
jgi:hypothetical protein